MVPTALRNTALAVVLATSSLPALSFSAQAAPWGWHGGWGGWGWGGLGIGLAAGLIGSALATPSYAYGYPSYPYYPAYGYYPSYYPAYVSYPAYPYYPTYGYGYARAAYWGPNVYLQMNKGSAAGKHASHRR